MARWIVLAAALTVLAGCKPDVVYLDVRAPQEYAAGHVEGAINIPYDQLPARWQELESRDSVVIYCLKGGRARIAERTLREHGFQHLENAGGLADLVGRGLLVVQ